MADAVKNISRIIQRAFASEVQFGEVIYPPGGALGPRTQCQFQLVLLWRGEGLIEVDDERIVVSAGEVVLLRPGGLETFEFARSTETRHSWCSINPGLVPRALARQLRAAPRQMPIPRSLDALVSVGLRSGAGGEDTDLLSRLAVSALTVYVRAARLARRLPALPGSLQRACELVENDYATPLTVGEIARRSGISPNHLIRLFRRHLGETPAAYLWRWRTDQGVRLLRETGLTISEIAFRTGFQNPFHFSRLVRRLHRLAPRELRRSWWRQGAKP